MLLLSVTIEEPLQFSAFAPALLVATLFRLSLDVSATRLILTQGATPGAVGIVDVYAINSSVKVIRIDGKLPFDVGYALKGN